MRGSITDLMPDPLTPLFATMGVPAINAAMGRTFRGVDRRQALPSGGLFDHNQRLCLHAHKAGLSGLVWVLFRMGPALPRAAQRREALA